MVETSVRSQEPPSAARERRWYCTGRTRQTGSFIVILPLAMLSLFGIIGLTLTTANAFLDRSKLQNLLDAMALAAAQSVNERNALSGIETAEKCRSGEQRAQDLFNETVKTFGNGTLQPRLTSQSDMPAVKFEYATSPDATFGDTCPEISAARGIYVRASFRDMIAANFHEMLTGIANDFHVSASAVAGPATVSVPFCPLPIYVCDGSADPDEACVDPNSPDCAYGHRKNVELCGDISAGTGTFCSDPDPDPDSEVGLLDWGGDADMAAGLAGCGTGACPRMAPTRGTHIPVTTFANLTDPKIDPLRVAYNTRFFGATDAGTSWPPPGKALGGSTPGPNVPPAGDPGECSSSRYPGPDRVSANWDDDEKTTRAAGLGFGGKLEPVHPDDPPLYQQYLKAGGSQSVSRRLVTLPVVSPCPKPGDAAATVTVQGYVCALLTRPMMHILPAADPDADRADTSTSIVLQLVDGCESRGIIGPGAGGISRIVLYKDRRSGDS